MVCPDKVKPVADGSGKPLVTGCQTGVDWTVTSRTKMSRRMEPLSEYQELHVISDLHIGGVAPFQIFDQGDLLAQTIDHLRDQSPNKQVALLINGDMVDFLAEDKAKYFDPIGAVGKLDRIFRDPAFAPVWDALQRFVQKNKRTLIINLGNHDLELALPWVREHLLDQLSGGNDRARGRIILSLDGAGCLCRVGRAKVLCVHGNEVDTWNVTDYEMLRRQGRELNQGRDVKEWTPNAGAKLVIDVMNDIKREYPFVDLLKPEVEAVVPVLYALKPSLVSKIGAVMSVGTRLAWDAVRRMSGFLGEEETAPDAEAAEVDPRQAMESLLRETFVTSPQQYSDADALLRAAEERLEGGSTTSVNVRGGEDQYLGLPTTANAHFRQLGVAR
ncbi:MAG: metallophosphoesterase [Planctomycetota bacterium]|nr:metallophosphoesterase [Planctomycetota bacterium]